ncbi:MAG: hypothetical protein KDA30_15465 [Phycisphaerales bacterium]|nr:hypothetical protein [Phycisphaerales bacterium]
MFADALKEGKQSQFRTEGIYKILIMIDTSKHSTSTTMPPIWFDETGTIEFTDKRGGPLQPPADMTEQTVIEVASEQLTQGLLPSAVNSMDDEITALRRGSGSRTLLYWPGVAQRVRIHSPRALALTGFLTLAGFTTLFIQRRRRRARTRAGHCPNCGYDLAGITSPTCPECGNAHASPDA